MGKIVNLEGKKINSILVLRFYKKDKQNRKIWWCKCDCGKEKPIRSRHLMSGQVKTCGCKIGYIPPKPFLGLKGKKHPKWKGGKFISEDGYVMEYIGNGKYDLQHRIKYIKKYGAIPKGHVVHHKNEDKTDNRFCNLELMTRKDHAIHHDLGSLGDRSNLIWNKR